MGWSEEKSIFIPSGVLQLDVIVNSAFNGIAGLKLKDYATFSYDAKEAAKAMKKAYKKDPRAREKVLEEIRQFVSENKGKRPVVLLFGENHNDLQATRFFNYFIKRIPEVNMVGMETFLNNQDKETAFDRDDYKNLQKLLKDKRESIIKLLDRKEETINLYGDPLLERIVMSDGQQALIDHFLQSELIIPDDINLYDVLYEETKLNGSEQDIQNLRLLSLTILVTAINTISEDGILTRLETLQHCRDKKIKAFGFHQVVGAMDPDVLSANRNSYYTWALDCYYSQVIMRYMDAEKERDSVVMALNLGAAHAERSHLPMMMPDDVAVMIIDLASTSKPVEDAIDASGHGADIGWIELSKIAISAGYSGARVADIYLHYPTPAEAPF